MGSQVKAICKCGYNKEVLIGGGRLNFKTIEYFPCYCENCHDMVQGNLKADKLICPSCGSPKISSYNNKHLIGKKGNQIVEQSFNNVLTDNFYKCSKCEQMNLQFFQGGILWD